jgi:acetyltransferase-like isoleucine patch superfamily enzyme
MNILQSKYNLCICSVVRVGSVLTPYSVVGGVPAKLIKKRK